MLTFMLCFSIAAIFHFQICIYRWLTYTYSVDNYKHMNIK